jgi:hypothetical protein
MARTGELIADKEATSVVVRLMMALNDIAMANEGLGEWTFTQERRKLARQNGGRLYYGRMLMAHVFEALSIVEEIRDNPKLKALVETCDPETRSSFDAVAAFLKTDDYAMLARIRNNASFHYDRKLAARAVEQISHKFPAHVSPYSLGHDALDWYFELGDHALDRIVVRDIFKAPEHVDLRAAIDPILLRMHKMARGDDMSTSLSAGPTGAVPRVAFSGRWLGCRGRIFSCSGPSNKKFGKFTDVVRDEIQLIYQRMLLCW